MSNNLQKCRQIYVQAQNDIKTNRLNRFNQDRMRKRYLYIDKQITKNQTQYTKKEIQQLKFYRNKFNSLVFLINQSVRSSYTKGKFQTEVKNILKDNWNNDKEKIQKNNNQQQQPKKIRFVQNKNISKQSQKIEKTQRSKSPLQIFFEQSQLIKNVNFMSVMPKYQVNNSQILKQIKKMPKKHIKQDYPQNDSRIRDLKRQNQQLQKIARKKQIQIEEPKKIQSPKNIVDQLKKELYYFQKVNQQLRQNNFRRKDQNQSESLSPYEIRFRNNNVNQIEYRNLQYNTSKTAVEKLKRTTQYITQNRSRSKSPLNKRIFKDQEKSVFSTLSKAQSKVQRQKQVYINSTPQVLFENQLIKIMVIRNPLKIQQKMILSNNQNQNPQDLTPNEQKLELIILNNTGDIVKPQELFIKTQYLYDQNLHKISTFKVPTKNYNKKISNSKNIVFCQIIRIKLLDKQGYNEQIKVNIKSQFFYNTDTQRKRNRMAQIIEKKQNKFQITIKLPVTFIQFSNQPFSETKSNLQKIKLNIVPNNLYDTFDHTYMNTKLPIKKIANNEKVNKETCIIYGRSFIHKNINSLQNNRKNKGIYLQSQIQLIWTQKKDMRYLSISTIQQWAYLISYMFMDIQQEQEEFQKQFRKPSMHVFFNMLDNRIV